jgi:hypothetical protein
MQPRYGLYLLLVVVSTLAVIFAALRAWGTIGLVPLIFGAIATWAIQAGLRLERDFDSGLMSFAGILFALAGVLTLMHLIMHSVSH